VTGRAKPPVASAVDASHDNPFLGPLLSRWLATPSALFGTFYDGDAEQWRPITLDEFMRRARQFTALFRQAGANRGAIVQIILEHGLDAHAAFIGAMLFGGIPSFLPHPNSKQSDEAYWRHHHSIFAHTRPRIILVYDRLEEAVANAAAGAAVIRLSAVDPLPPDAVPEPPDPDSIALLQHSSGTTGLKKGVALSYRAICRQLASYAVALNLAGVRQPRIASWLPLYHDMGLISSFLLPLWLGIPIVTMSPFEWVAEPTLLFDAIETHHATHVWLPNFAFMHMARAVRADRRWDLSSLVALVSCSEPCKPEAFDIFAGRLAESHVRLETLQTCYAMAETVFAVTQSKPGQAVRRLEIDRSCIDGNGRVVPPASPASRLTLLSNGEPVQDCDVQVLRDGKFAGEREIGELCIQAPFLFSGYHNNPDATKAAFHQHWYRTGDLGFIDANEVFVVGRLKDVIIVNGKNIFAHDVEAAVSRISGVKPGRAVAFGCYAPDAGSEKLVVVAERQSETTDDAQIVRGINRAVLNEIGIPPDDVRVVAQGWLVKTTSGKISRADNARKYQDQIQSGLRAQSRP
jgi:acyl-CoA synthetase (AMP-forming)/AMP-acid ligase II